MNKIVIATTNKNKIERIKKMFKGEKYTFVGIDELKIDGLQDIEETQNTPVNIAMEKALYYVNFIPEDCIVLCQDDTLNFEGISVEDDPGLHIKRPVVEKYGEFSDEKAADYYTSLANKYGGSIPVVFNYGHAIGVKENNNGRIITKVFGSPSKLEARLVNKINKLETVPGYFLSSIMEVKVDNEWKSYNDLDDETLVSLDFDLYNSISELLKNIERE